MPLLGLIFAGLVISGLAEALPSFLRFSIVFLLFSYLPGDVIVTRLFRVTFASLPLRIAAAFAVGLSFYSVITWLCWLFGASFHVLSGVLQVVTLAGWAGVVLWLLPHTSGAESATGPPMSGRLVVGLAAVVGLFFAFAPPQLTHRGDGFDHIGYLRAIERENAIAPDGVLATPSDEGVRTVKSDPRKGTLHPLLAVAADLAVVDPLFAWRALPAWLAPAAVMCFWVFATRILPSGAYAPFALLLFIMFQGGLGRHFLGNVAYGQHLSLVFHWLLVALVIVFSRDTRGRLVVMMLVILVGASAIHIDALIHFGLFALTLLFFYRVFGLSFGTTVVLLSGAAFVAVVVLWWKLAVSVGAANALHTHPQGLLYMSDIGSRWFVPSPIEILKRFGLLFLVGMAMTPALLLVREHRRHALMALAIAVPPLVLAMNPLVAPLIYDKGTYLLHRFLLNVPVFCVTALVLGALIAWSARGRLLRKAFAFVLVLMWARVFMLSFGAWSNDMRRVDFSWSPVVGDELSGVADYFKENAGLGTVVLSDPVTSYTLTALADVRAVTVLHQHANPNDPIGEARVAVVRDAMSPYALQAQLLRTLHRFTVDYIVVNATPQSRSREFLAEWSPEFAQAMRPKIDSSEETFRLVFEQEGISVFRVVGRDPAEPTWYPTVPFVRNPPSALQRCEGVAFEAPLEIVGVAVEPATGVAGDMVAMTIAYRKNADPSATNGQLKLRIRLEDADYFASVASYPGDKYVRRFRERRDARFRRFGFDRKPFGGLYDDSLWPIGQVVCETFNLRLPTDLFEKEYVIRCRLDRDPLIANFAMKDLLFNADSYVGPACGRIAIVHPPGGIKHIK